jgi:hypothetical protein
MNRSKIAPFRIALAMALALVAAPAAAQVSPAALPPADAEPRGWLGWSLDVAGGALGAVGGAVGYVWSTAVSFVLPEAPFDYIPERLSEGSLAFVGVMEAAGFQLADIQTGGGFLPFARYRFVLSREPSATDIARARRALALHQERFGGITAMVQQRIMQTLLEVAEGGRFRVTAVELGVRPWPSIRYELSARDHPLEQSERRILEGVQR